VAGKQPRKAYDEALITYFVENVCGEADAVYRFAIALTLSPDGARRCVEKVFEEISDNLEEHYRSRNLHKVLAAECWKAFSSLKKRGFKEGQSAVTKALKPIPEKARAALVAVDVLGLKPEEAADAFAWEEKEMRVNLAQARKHLVSEKLEL